jgi:hypothetical protein
MPVQINEVIIRTAVDAPPPSASTTKEAPQQGKNISDESIAELIAELLKEQTER